MTSLVVGIIVALASLLGTIIVGKLQHSGRINTSEAARLWDKTDKIAENLQKQIEVRDARILILEQTSAIEILALKQRIDLLESDRLKQAEEYMLLNVSYQTAKIEIEKLTKRLGGTQ